MKRVISVFLAAVLILGVFTVPVGAVRYPDAYPNTHKNTGKNLADLIAVAKTQIGYTELSTSTGQPLKSTQSGGYTKYGAWFGSSTSAWCAYFVVWCSDQADISTSIIPRMGSCSQMINWFKGKGRYFKSGALTPRTGDLVFYDWSTGSPQHVGIVTGVTKSSIYTIEGNTGGSKGYRCEARTRSRTNGIIGYARPAYNDALTYVGSYSFAEYAASKYKQPSTAGKVTKGTVHTKTSQLAVVTGSAAEITDESAVLKGRIENASSYAVTSSGFYFGEKKDSLTKYKVKSRTTKKSFDLSYNITESAGKLKTATTYYYCSYAVVNSKTYKGPVYTLVTADNRPKQLVLNQTQLTLEVGETFEIFYAVLPLEAKNEGVTWESADRNVVEVENGILKGVGTGKTTVTAKTKYGNQSASCSVTVKLAPADNISAKNVSENEILITWSVPSPKDIEGYEIYRSDTMFGEYEAIGRTDAETMEFYDPTVSKGESYYYKILTFGTSREYNSELSRDKREKALIPCPEYVEVARKGASLVLTWSECEEAKSYCVYKSDSPDGKFTFVCETSDCFFRDYSLKVGTGSYYKVTAKSKNTESKFSVCRGREITALPQPKTDSVTRCVFGEIDFSSAQELKPKREAFAPFNFISFKK